MMTTQVRTLYTQVFFLEQSHAKTPPGLVAGCHPADLDGIPHICKVEQVYVVCCICIYHRSDRNIPQVEQHSSSTSTYLEHSTLLYQYTRCSTHLADRFPSRTIYSTLLYFTFTDLLLCLGCLPTYLWYVPTYVMYIHNNRQVGSQCPGSTSAVCEPVTGPID